MIARPWLASARRAALLLLSAFAAATSSLTIGYAEPAAPGTAAATVASAAGVPTYSRFVVFGDSLSSGGRGKSGPSTGPAPTAENGGFPRETWVMQLSVMAGIGPLVKWEEGGSNYAVGGTTTTQLVEQVSRYLKAGPADPKALHLLWSGGNDLSHAIRDLAKDKGFFSLFGLEKTLVSCAEQAAERLAGQIDRLAEAGAVHVVWINLPDLSRTPSLSARTSSFPGVSGMAERAVRHASQAFNRRMATAVERLHAARPNLDLVTVDAEAFFAQVMQRPGDFGFTDVRQPSRVSNQHLFFDNIHPTSHGHREIARYIQQRLIALGRLPASSAAPATVATRDRAEPEAAPVAPTGDVIRAADEAFVASMRRYIATRPIVRRPTTLAELAADPAFKMKYREKPAHMAHADNAGWERFALSLGDAEAANHCAQVLPAIAVAARLSGDPVLTKYLQDQLAEIATWAPFQRAGWSGGSNVQAAWLGTGWMVRAIVKTLIELPENALTPELRAALVARLDAEIAGIREDWKTRRTWFTRTESVSSNQWVLPLEALALASLFTGLDRHRDDFEFAIANLQRSLDAQGKAGECVEGMQYGFITYESLLSVALTTRAFGDERIFRHPWIHAFPTWYLHHRQPGGYVVNAFDSQNRDLDWGLVAAMASGLDDPAARWVWRHRPEALADTPVLALAKRTLAVEPATAKAEPPAAFAFYPTATRVNWLESVEAFKAGPANRVSGFWMRGGGASDAHDHQDRGHVNFVIAGQPVLIEAGLQSYGLPDHPTHYKSVAGHNVLQVGGNAPEDLTAALLSAKAGQILDPAHRAAPMTVHRLDPSGGEVSVDATGCYARLGRWVRTARWDAKAVEIRDEVRFLDPEIALFRWHLGEPASAVVTSQPGVLRVGNVLLEYSVEGVELEASVVPMPDHTLSADGSRHATVVLRTARPVSSLILTTHVSLAPSPATHATALGASGGVGSPFQTTLGASGRVGTPLPTGLGAERSPRPTLKTSPATCAANLNRAPKTPPPGGDTSPEIL